MPIYSDDRKRLDGIPEKAYEFKNLIKDSDGIVISLAEHNGSYTAAFKNIYDWISVIEEIVFEEAPEEEEVDEIFTIVEDQPTPPGGMSAFYKYVATSLRYPAQARRMGIEGKVFVQFVVGKDGTLTDVQAIKGIGAGCDEEAVRVISKAKKFIDTCKTPIVVKADGLAAGKGVAICKTSKDALVKTKEIIEGKFASSRKVVLEEFLEGEELSYFVVVDNNSYQFFGSAQDLKRVCEGDS